MKRLVCSVMLGLFLLGSLAPAAALAESKAHHRAVKVCKQKYKDAVRGAKYLKHRQRTERIETARREREECEKLAPR